jgi:biotin transport system substrate-specific component
MVPGERRTLADTIPGDWVRDVVLVVGFALLTALAAQITIPLGFTPVPITGQTFAVLLAGGALGATRGASSQFLYVALGAIGLPFYSDQSGGWDVATGATAGYLVGFVIAAGVVGWMAERGQDRKVSTAIPAFVVGSLLIYVTGAMWLSAKIDVPIYAEAGTDSAITLGVAPFLIGDGVKAVLAGLVLPTAWQIRDKIRPDRG